MATLDSAAAVAAVPVADDVLAAATQERESLLSLSDSMRELNRKTPDERGYMSKANRRVIKACLQQYSDLLRGLALRPTVAPHVDVAATQAQVAKAQTMLDRVREPMAFVLALVVVMLVLCICVVCFVVDKLILWQNDSDAAARGGVLFGVSTLLSAVTVAAVVFVFRERVKQELIDA